jgi:hypothetical protein
MTQLRMEPAVKREYDFSKGKRGKPTETVPVVMRTVEATKENVEKLYPAPPAPDHGTMLTEAIFALMEQDLAAKDAEIGALRAAALAFIEKFDRQEFARDEMNALRILVDPERWKPK